jgi:hypothetical protein
MTPLNTIFGISILLIGGAYIVAFSYLQHYLRSDYTMTWMNLGQPSFPPENNDLTAWVLSQSRTLQFVFSNQYKAVRDRRLTFLVMLIRVCSLLLISLFIALQALRLATQARTSGF